MKLTMPFLKAPSMNAKIAAAALLTLALATTPSAVAQFSGPAPGNESGVNRPLQITTDPALLFPADREPVLSPGDLLTVHIFGVTGTDDYSPVARVSLDGAIALPLAGVVHVQGLTLRQGADAIAQRLVAAGMYRNPQVTLLVTESPNQVVTVTGETHGIVPVVGKRRLLDALSVAGGLTPTSSHVITILRPGQDVPMNVDLGNDPVASTMANVPLFAGDTVIVSRTGVVYALGAFRTQSAIPLTGNTPLTVLQAITIAGGPNYEGNRADTRIIRTQGTHRVEVKVNMSRVLAGKDPDPVLQSDDILYLPTSALKAAIRAGGIATLMGIAQLSSYITLNSR
ncbi:polysaccharide biosynthesis/export family protein [Terriglobus tenax]|uniref:polysaccharide biosynthesis/export family protein n=1 Tax=Terriglobus tenax TaxID=1111115 RepID=UPI0021E0A9F2|nr:polysaccharide biosynthesis/export family protein [Terriglobus tenax]